KPTSVKDGPAALEALAIALRERAPFALALVDVQMPGMDGFAVAERIGRDAAFGATALGLMTPAGERGDAARCRQLGVRGSLAKPLATPELFQAILAALPSARPDDSSKPLVTRPPLRESARRLKVLHVEDNRANRLLVSQLLEKRGHTVIAVEDGREALATLDRIRVDVVLLDIQMPGMDGFETTAAIRAREKASERCLPIAAVTFHAREESGERGRSAGA